jgi:hypothetical protein
MRQFRTVEETIQPFSRDRHHFTPTGIGRSNSPSMTLELAEELDCSMCFDTGHVLVGFSGPVDFFEALERCLPRLGEIHLHDGPWQGPELKIGYGKDHQPLAKATAEAVPRLPERSELAIDIFELRIENALATNLIRSSG